MSAFAVLYDRLGGPLEPGLLERVMGRLSHRGPDGQDAFVSGPLAMGHWHFWTTPEEVGERQPLQVDGLPFRLVFDGRLDNREDLFAALSISVEEGRLLSDAALTLRAYAAWGERCVERFIGEFALVLFDERTHNLFCARDHLGDRTLFYAQHGSRVVIASEPWAILALPEFVAQADDVAAVHFFSFRAPQDGRTLFKDVFELLPGCQFSIKNGNLTAPSPYWQPNPTRTIRYKSDDEYAEHFLSLMDEAVRCRMRGSTQPAILMSGGLDSTTIASLAARQIAPRQLSTYSYVFDQFHDCDEREYIHAVKEKYNTRSVEINCDDLWPLSNWPEWVSYPNFPVYDVYFPIRQRAYRKVADEGNRILLTGDYGDYLYANDETWLGDMLLEGFLIKSFAELLYHLNNQMLRKALWLFYLRPTIRTLLSSVFGEFWRAKKLPVQPWITPFSKELLLSFSESPASSRGRFNSLFSLWISQVSAINPYLIFDISLECRYPSRDRRLVEFMAAVPSYQLYKRGVHRNILRTSMKDILPTKINKRVGKTSFLPLYFYGLEKRRNSVKEFLTHNKDIWSVYVQNDGFLDELFEPFPRSHDGAKKLIPWLCLSYVIWHKHFLSH